MYQQYVHVWCPGKINLRVMTYFEYKTSKVKSLTPLIITCTNFFYKLCKEKSDKIQKLCNS